VQVSKNESNRSVADPKLEQLAPGDNNPAQHFPTLFSLLLCFFAGFKHVRSPAGMLSHSNSLQTNLSVQSCLHLVKL